MIIYIFVLVFGLFFLKWLLTPDPEPKCQRYIQPNKWFPIKYVTVRVLLWMRTLQNKRTHRTHGDNAGYGMRSRNTTDDMDRIQNLPENHPQAVDAVYVSGANQDGVFLVAATSRRHNSVVQTLLYVRLPNMGLLELTTLPDTTLIGTEKKYAAGGLELEVIEPMKFWKIKFNGQMRIVETGKEVHVKFCLDWTAENKYFDFDTDLHPAVMADAIAREKWSKGYFSTLQKIHQTHYEQFGEMCGDVFVEGYNTRQVVLQSVRDHSYGNIRDWKLFHRYAIQYIFLKNGTSICVGTICMPLIMSRFVIGYMFHPDGQLDTVSSSEFEFFNFGEDGHPPEDMDFKFVAGGKMYDLHIKVLQAPEFYMGDNWDAVIHERMCRFSVNGIEGWGISEWAYRNYGGKDAKMEKNEILFVEK